MWHDDLASEITFERTAYLLISAFSRAEAAHCSRLLVMSYNVKAKPVFEPVAVRCLLSVLICGHLDKQTTRTHDTGPTQRPREQMGEIEMGFPPSGRISLWVWIGRFVNVSA
ncbi:TPA: hypothetical protein ACH3X2_007511 [Trebouxia sp. C0005]